MNTKPLLLAVAAIAVALLGVATGSPPAHVPKLPPLRVFAAQQRQNAVISALNANLSSGTATANSTVVCGLGGVLNSLAVGVQGTYSATLIVQVTADNVNWITVPNTSYTKVSDGSTGAVAGSGMWTVSVSGLSARVTCSAYTSGSVSVSLIPYSSGGGGSGGGSVTQGTSPWVTSSADGGIVTLGADADSATAGAGTANAHLREIATLLSGTIGVTGTITSALPTGTNSIGSVTHVLNSALIATNFTTSSSGDTQVVAGTSSKKIYVVSYAINANGATNVKFTDGAAGSQISMLHYLNANVGAVEAATVESPCFWTATSAHDLTVNNSAAVAISGHVVYYVQ